MQCKMKLFNFESQNLVVDWVSFNIQGLTDAGTIASIMGLKKSIRFLSGNIQDLRVTGSELRLFSLVKMLLIVITLSKLRNLIGRL